VSGGLLVGGTGSNVGKSLVVTGLARAISWRGLSVAPFKGQNMALNSAVTSQGEEVARAQAVQARAARCELRVEMNPVLLKPQAEGVSQLVVEGRPVGELAGDAWLSKARLLDRVVAAWHRLAGTFDLVLAEGAGSAAEVNLFDADLANCRLAAAMEVPVVLVADLEPGGAFATLAGHLQILGERWPGLVQGFVLNRVRGPAEILSPGVSYLEERFGARCLGLLPILPAVLPGEDSLNLVQGSPGRGALPVRVRAVRLPYLANFTDLDPLREEPDVDLRLVTEPSELADADLVILPGTKATVRALEWMHTRGLDRAIVGAARDGAFLLGICGGYQMLAESIEDEVESRVGTVPGLGLLAAKVVFRPEKTTRLVAGTSPALESAAVAGYEIHHGQVATSEQPLCLLGSPEGAIRGRVLGTSVHGLLDSDEWRGALLRWVARERGRSFATSLAWEAHVEAGLDLVAHAVEEHLDVSALLRLAGLPNARS